MPLSYRLLATCAGLALVPATHAATAWDEGVAGDFANVGTAPTGVTLGLGSNLIIGTTGRNAGVVDRDYFSFTIAAGLQLETLTVLPGTTFLGGSGLSFIAVQAGPQVTVNPTGGSAAGLLGWWHYNENDIGTDILPVIGIGPGASGFFGPLPEGTYSFWIQETGTGTAAYRFDFGVSVVPEPPVVMLLAAGLAALGWRQRSRQRQVSSSSKAGT